MLGMVTILRKLNILQYQVAHDGLPEIRFNPYNPLSYPIILILLIVAIIVGAVRGFVDFFDVNPFKYVK